MLVATLPIYAIAALTSTAAIARMTGLAGPTLFVFGLRQATQHMFRQPGDGLLTKTFPIHPRSFHLEDAEGALDPLSLAREMDSGKALFLKKAVRLGSISIEAGEPITAPLAAAFIELGWTIEATSPLFYNLERLRPVVPTMAKTDRPWMLTAAEIERLRQALVVPVRMEFRGFKHADIQATGAYAPVVSLVKELQRLG